MNDNEKQVPKKNLNAPSETETSLPPVTTLNNETARHKMIFLALLSCAMEYRKTYIEQDVEANRVLCEEIGNVTISEKSKVKPKRGQMKVATMEKKVTAKMITIHNEYKRKVEKFNDICAKEIEFVRQEFKIDNDKKFNTYAEGFGKMVEQYINAKSTGDIVSVCHAYNAGLLDELLKAIRSDEVEEKEEFLNKVESIENPAIPD